MISALFFRLSSAGAGGARDLPEEAAMALPEVVPRGQWSGGAPAHAAG
jgi:hypothetical protein